MTPPLTSDPAAEAVSALREALEAWLGQYFPALSSAGIAMLTRSLMDYDSSPLAPLLADIAVLRTRAEEAEARAERIDAKLGELNAKVAECLPPAETLVAEREAATADRDRLADEVVRLSAELAATRSSGTGRSEAEAIPGMPFRSVSPEETHARAEALADAHRREREAMHSAGRTALSQPAKGEDDA